LRIILVVGKFPQLSETFILRKAIALAERGHQVTVAARSCGDWEGFNDRPLPAGLSVQTLISEWGWSNPWRAPGLIARVITSSLQSPLRAFDLIRHCHRHAVMKSAPWRHFIRHLPFINKSADVVNFEFLGLAAMYPLVPKLVDAPMVVGCRGTELHLLDQTNPNQEAALLNCLKRADAVHCVSNNMAIKVAELSGRANTRDGIWVNRPAVPTEKISPKDRWAANDPPIILAVGRLVWIKGYDYFLAALSRLKQSGIAFKAQIIGDGPLYAQLRYSIEDLNLKPEVELLGPLTSVEVLERMRRADLFVLSSHAEGISNAALEAMATGLPIVTTNAGGMPEAVRDGIDGYVVPARDIPALTDGLRSLLIDAGLRERMGRAARSRAEADFSLSRQVEVFEQLYQSVASGGRIRSMSVENRSDY
jgi:glycosyltransferase involved in cell wall biosynthesis